MGQNTGQRRMRNRQILSVDCHHQLQTLPGISQCAITDKAGTMEMWCIGEVWAAPRHCCSKSCTLLSCSFCCCVSRRSVSSCVRSRAFSSHRTSLCCSSSCISSSARASWSLRSSSRRDTTWGNNPCEHSSASTHTHAHKPSQTTTHDDQRHSPIMDLVEVLAQQRSGLWSWQVAEFCHEVHLPLGEHAGRGPQLSLPLSNGLVFVLDSCIQSLDRLVKLEECSLLLKQGTDTRTYEHAKSWTNTVHFTDRSITFKITASALAIIWNLLQHRSARVSRRLKCFFFFLFCRDNGCLGVWWSSALLWGNYNLMLSKVGLR